MSENDVAWERIFAQSSILDEIEMNGYCHVSATELKRLSNREPRLLAKLDTSSVCPKVFRDNGLAIFPTRNGEYVIFKDVRKRSYYHFHATQFADKVAQQYQSSIDLYEFDAFPGMLYLNESQAIDFAYISSLLREFTGETELHLAIRGRIRSGDFDFVLPEVNHKIEVSGVQIEVDAGYESAESIYLIEAKIGTRDDFNIRQLYYPYLEWSRRSQKHIVPILMIFTNGKYHFIEFKFNVAFGDLEIVRAQSYVINETPVVQLRLSDLLKSIQPEVEPSITFPQADDLDKVVDVVSLFGSVPVTKYDIAEHFEFDERQGDYYANAAAYLGLAQRGASGFELTELGRTFASTRALSRRNKILIEQMLKRPVFHGGFRLLGERSMQLEHVTKDEIATLISRYTSLGQSTPGRRASTVRSWMRWVQQNSKMTF